MKSEWRVTYNPMLKDSTPYGVYRLRDRDGIDHSGNRESIPEMYATKVEAVAKAAELNKEETIEFMYNPANAGNCAECPANMGFQQGGAYICGPCGQQNCWVDAHCSSTQYEEG